VLCPECGTVAVTRRDRIADRAQLRPEGLALAAFGFAFLAWWRPPVDTATVVALATTKTLLQGKGLLGTYTPLEARVELRRRAENRSLDPSEERRFVELLVADLKDDGVIGNAQSAVALLDGLAGPHVDLLLAVVDAEDKQQRRLARKILFRLEWGAAVPERLIDAAIEDLGEDDIRRNAIDADSFLTRHIAATNDRLLASVDDGDPQRRSRALHLIDSTLLEPADRRTVLDAMVASFALASRCSHYRRGVHWRRLLEEGEAALPSIRAGLASDDAQIRLLCAALLGCLGDKASLEQSVAILAPHLADNTIEGDAIIAARALFGFGPDVLPHLEPWAIGDRGHDEQLRQSIAYLRGRFEGRTSIAELQRRHPLARLTTAGVDACVLDPDSLEMPLW
jgi:hypothetical protein